MRSSGNTVGLDIQSTENDGYAKGEEAKFVATNGAAIAKSASTASGLRAAIGIASGYPFGVTAELPYGEAVDVSSRAVSLILHGGPIVGSSDQIGVYSYYPSSPNHWEAVTSSFGFEVMPTVVSAPDDVAQDLDAHRSWILDHDSVTYGSTDQTHADVIVDPSTNRLVDAGTRSGVPSEGDLASLFMGWSGYNGTSYRDVYDDDDTLIASSKVYTKDGAAQPDSSNYSFSEQDVYDDQGMTTIGVRTTTRSDGSPFLTDFLESTTDTSNTWKNFFFDTGTKGTGYDQSGFSNLSVTNQDNTSYELFQFTPTDADDNDDGGVSHLVWSEVFYDAGGNATQRNVHYDASVDPIEGSGQANQDQYGTDWTYTPDDQGNWIGNTGNATQVLPGGFNPTWDNARQIFNNHIPPNLGSTVA